MGLEVAGLIVGGLGLIYASGFLGLGWFVRLTVADGIGKAIKEVATDYERKDVAAARYEALERRLSVVESEVAGIWEELADGE